MKNIHFHFKKKMEKLFLTGIAGYVNFNINHLPFFVRDDLCSCKVNDIILSNAEFGYSPELKNFSVVGIFNKCRIQLELSENDTIVLLEEKGNADTYTPNLKGIRKLHNLHLYFSYQKEKLIIQEEDYPQYLCPVMNVTYSPECDMVTLEFFSRSKLKVCALSNPHPDFLIFRSSRLFPGGQSKKRKVLIADTIRQGGKALKRELHFMLTEFLGGVIAKDFAPGYEDSVREYISLMQKFITDMHSVYETDLKKMYLPGVYPNRLTSEKFSELDLEFINSGAEYQKPDTPKSVSVKGIQESECESEDETEVEI